MSLFTWITGLWHARQRSIDVGILWKACKQEVDNQGMTLDHAKVAFAAHVYHDKAWLVLGEDEIRRRIGELK
jgi:hypothetical protein